MSVSDLFDAAAHAQSWQAAAKRFTELAGQVPLTNWTPAQASKETPRLPSGEAIVRSRVLTRATFFDVSDEYARALRELINERPVPSLSEPAKFWVRLSLLTAAQFCLEMVIPGESSARTIVPCPWGTQKQLLAWLVNEWWLTHGLRRATTAA